MSKPILLLADDHEEARNAWRFFFEDLGLLVTTAADRAEAIQIATASRPDVAIVDLMIPSGIPGGAASSKEGLALLKDLLALYGDLPVIVLTAFASHVTAVEAMRAGAFDYVSKTDSQASEELALRVEKALKQSIQDHHASMGDDEKRKARIKLLAEARQETNPNQKGRLLEQLLALLFRDVSGFVVSTNLWLEHPREELDVVIRNESSDPFWAKLGTYIVAECKNWSAPVAADAISRLRDKSEDRHGVQLAFLVTLGRLTTEAKSKLLQSRSKKPTIVPIEGDDVDALVISDDVGGHLKSIIDRTIVGA